MGGLRVGVVLFWSFIALWFYVLLRLWASTGEAGDDLAFRSVATQSLVAAGGGDAGHVADRAADRVVADGAAPPPPQVGSATEHTAAPHDEGGRAPVQADIAASGAGDASSAEVRADARAPSEDGRGGASPLPGDTAAATFVALSEWVRVAGGHVGCIELRQPANGPRGVYATCDIAEGEEAIVLPVTRLGTVRQALSTPAGKAVLAAARSKGLERMDLDGMLLTAWLLEETNKAHSAVSPYLDSLPSDFAGMPWGFADEQADACARGLAADGNVQYGRERLKRELELFQEAFSKVPGLNSSALTWQRYTRARFATFSRTFTVARLRLQMDEDMAFGFRLPPPLPPSPGGPSGVSVHGADEAYVLAPLADMLNHERGDRVNCRWQYGGRGFGVETRRAIKKGEQLAFSYGEAKDNSVFLVDYGFVEVGNPNDKLNVSFPCGASPVVVTLAGQPMEQDQLQIILEACRAEARQHLGGAAAPGAVELEALRQISDAIASRSAEIAPPAGCPSSCADYRRNIMALLDTWGGFARRAMAFVEGRHPEEAESGAAVPDRFRLLTRLYFGLWLRMGGDRFARTAELLETAAAFGSVRYMDIVIEAGV